MKAIFTILLFICLCLLGSSQAGGVSYLRNSEFITSYHKLDPNESSNVSYFHLFQTSTAADSAANAD